MKKIITVRLDERDYDRVKAEAARRKMSMNWFSVFAMLNEVTDQCDYCGRTPELCKCPKVVK